MARIASAWNEQVHLEGDVLIAVDQSSGAVIYDFAGPGDPVLATRIDKAETRFLDSAVDRGRLTLVTHEHNATRLEVQDYAILGPHDVRQDGAAAEIMVRLSNSPFLLPIALATSAANRLLLLHGHELSSLPRPAGQERSSIIRPAWVSPAGDMASIDVATPWVATGMTHGDVVIHDARWPDLIGLRARTEMAPRRTNFVVQTFGTALTSDTLWSATVLGVHASSVHTDSTGLGVVDRGLAMAMVRDGDIVYAAVMRDADSSQLLVLEGRRPPGGAFTLLASIPVPAGSVRDMTIDDGLLWLGGSVRTATGGVLIAVDVSDPAAPRMVGRVDTAEPIFAVASSSTHVGILTATPRGTDFFSLLDVADRSRPQVVGTLDIGPTYLDPISLIPIPLGDVVAHDGTFVVAHPDRGVLRIDARVPEHPTEIASFRLPGQPIRLAQDDGTFWTGGFGGGLTSFRWDPLPLRPDLRLWLPLLNALAPAASASGEGSAGLLERWPLR